MRRAGLVQAVDVPAGRGILTWSYRPPGLRTGSAMSLGATVLILLMLAAGRLLSRSRRPRGLPGDVPEPRPAAKPMVRNG